MNILGRLTRCLRIPADILLLGVLSPLLIFLHIIFRLPIRHPALLHVTHHIFTASHLSSTATTTILMMYHKWQLTTLPRLIIRRGRHIGGVLGTRGQGLFVATQEDIQSF
jgi:hypothetical protein